MAKKFLMLVFLLLTQNIFGVHASCDPGLLIPETVAVDTQKAQHDCCPSEKKNSPSEQSQEPSCECPDSNFYFPALFLAPAISASHHDTALQFNERQVLRVCEPLFRPPIIIV